MWPDPFMFFNFFNWFFNHNETLCQAHGTKRRAGVKRAGKASKLRRGR